MSGINDYKITDTTGYKVADVEGSTLTGTVAENKQTFDKLGELIITHFNDTIDYLKTKNVDNSYTAKTGKPTGDLTPAFGDDVTVSQVVTDSSGRVTNMTDRTITIPNTLATTTSAGLMSAEDKQKIYSLPGGGITITGSITFSGAYHQANNIPASNYGLSDWSDYAVISTESKLAGDSDYGAPPIIKAVDDNFHHMIEVTRNYTLPNKMLSINGFSNVAQTVYYRIVLILA